MGEERYRGDRAAFFLPHAKRGGWWQRAFFRALTEGARVDDFRKTRYAFAKLGSAPRRQIAREALLFPPGLSPRLPVDQTAMPHAEMREQAVHELDLIKILAAKTRGFPGENLD